MLASIEAWQDGDKWTMKSTEQSVYFSAVNSIMKDLVRKENS